MISNILASSVSYEWHGETTNSMASYSFTRETKSGHGLQKIFDSDRSTYLRKKKDDGPVEINILFTPPLIIENVEIILPTGDGFDESNFQGIKLTSKQIFHQVTNSKIRKNKNNYK